MQIEPRHLNFNEVGPLHNTKNHLNFIRTILTIKEYDGVTLINRALA